MSELIFELFKYKKALHLYQNKNLVQIESQANLSSVLQRIFI